MKKFFSFAAIAVMIATSMMVMGCKETPQVLWNVEAQASGDGKITVSYPTGNPGLVVEGAATVVATTTNDTTVAGFAVPNGVILLEDVLAEPDVYTKAQVSDANVLANATASGVQFDVEGTWNASVIGYAKYGEIYFVINEVWPRPTEVEDSVE